MSHMNHTAFLTKYASLFLFYADSLGVSCIFILGLVREENMYRVAFCDIFISVGHKYCEVYSLNLF